MSFNRYMVECESLGEWENICRIDGFNRYMVECEYGIVRKENKIVFVLIDTWWNVNLDISIFEGKCNTRFNRYMVECE